MSSSFVVRFSGGPEAGFSGLVEHVVSGRTLTFADRDELLRVLERLRSAGVDRGPAT